jgi:hypothetical protein
MVDNLPLHHRLSAWLVTALGLAGSVAANVGHVPTHDLATRATAAVPPLAAATSLWVGMGVLKRVVSGIETASIKVDTAMADEPPEPERNPAIQPDKPDAIKVETAFYEMAARPSASDRVGDTRVSKGGGQESANNSHGGGQIRSQRRRPTARTATSARERVKRVLTANPGLSIAEVVSRAGASERTITRARQDLC